MPQHSRNNKRIERRLIGFLDYFKPKEPPETQVTATTAQYYPISFDEYIGQDNAIKRLKIAIKASLVEGRQLGDILFYGYPGTGKTALAQIIAKEMNAPIKTVIGGAIENQMDLAEMIATAPDYSLVFIDEIHAVPKKLQELLYSAFDNGTLDVTGEAGQAKLVLPKITIIGATTEIGRLNKPLINRFQNVITLEDYTEVEMAEIIKQSIARLNRKIKLDDKAIMAIAKRARFTPRTANNLLGNIIDYCVSESIDHCHIEQVKKMALIMGVYDNGATKKDIILLKTIFEVFGNRAVGLKTLSGALMEDEKTVEHIYEPFLLRKGFLTKTARGRQVTDEGIVFLTNITKYDIL